MSKKLIGLNKNLGMKNKEERRSRGREKSKIPSCTLSRNALGVYGLN